MRQLPSERSEKVRRSAARDRNPPTDPVVPPTAGLRTRFPARLLAEGTFVRDGVVDFVGVRRVVARLPALVEYGAEACGETETIHLAVWLFRVRLVDVLEHLDVSLSGHDGAEDRRLAGRAWRRPKWVAACRRPSRENPGRAPGRVRCEERAAALDVWPYGRALPFPVDVRFVGRYTDRDGAHDDGTDADDGFRAGNPGGEPLSAIFGH